VQTILIVEDKDSMAYVRGLLRWKATVSSLADGRKASAGCDSRVDLVL
jgi:hypothetical protein